MKNEAYELNRLLHTVKELGVEIGLARARMRELESKADKAHNDVVNFMGRLNKSSTREHDDNDF